jgi:hypothetical protein
MQRCRVFQAATWRAVSSLLKPVPSSTLKLTLHKSSNIKHSTSRIKHQPRSGIHRSTYSLPTALNRNHRLTDYRCSS